MIGLFNYLDDDEKAIDNNDDDIYYNKNPVFLWLLYNAVHSISHHGSPIVDQRHCTIIQK